MQACIQKYTVTTLYTAYSIIRDHYSRNRPPTGFLLQFRIIYKITVQRSLCHEQELTFPKVNDTDVEEQRTGFAGSNQRHFSEESRAVSYFPRDACLTLILKLHGKRKNTAAAGHKKIDPCVT